MADFKISYVKSAKNSYKAKLFSGISSLKESAEITRIRNFSALKNLKRSVFKKVI